MNSITGPAFRHRTIVAALLCAFAGAALIGVATAADDVDAPSVAVRYQPQSLDTEHGAQALYRRIVNAAAIVCPQYAVNPHWLAKPVQECREQAVARAVLKINSPKLVAVYAANTKNG